MAETLEDYIASQDQLVQEASQAIPHQFSQCSYLLGPIRQAVYLCLTCPEARGLCSACSVACHTDHEQLELFPKRNFRCDCPTTATAHPCSLHPVSEKENANNVYGQNFRGIFCRCGRDYDPKTERETMIQCLSCEDWFHESCCNLRMRPPSRDISPEPLPKRSGHAEEGIADDALSDASSSGLPPPLISGSEYQAFVCVACVLKIPVLKRWAGTRGIAMVTRDSSSESWKCLGRSAPHDPHDAARAEDQPSRSNTGIKRPLSPSNSESPDAKRPRGDSSSATLMSRCHAPEPNPIAQRIFADLDNPAESSLGAGDVFLPENFREQWCQCSLCLPTLQDYPFLLEEEETYEPPEDPDSGLSLEELGMRALERIPRDRAIDGIRAFNGLRDDLVKYLRPFAEEGKIVRETDVRNFFADLAESSKRNQE